MPAIQQSEWAGAEAAALLGRRVRTKVAFSGVPAGTTATVVRVSPGSGGYRIALEWDLTGRAAPLVDWFRRAEWERFIEMLP
jgi:hypothetical protein